MSRAEKRAMIDPSHKHLSVVQQCGLLGLGRSSFYYQPVQVNAVDLVLMAAIDRQFLETPYYGSRRMVAILRRAGYVVNRKRARYGKPEIFNSDQGSQFTSTAFTGVLTTMENSPELNWRANLYSSWGPAHLHRHRSCRWR
jgi:transposase InsO family protein